MGKYKIYTIAGIIFIIGVVVFMCGFSMTGFNISKLSTNGEYVEKSYSSTDNVKKINIDTSDIEVEIKKSRDSKIHITYYENDNYHYNITESGNVLSIEKTNNRAWFYMNFFNFDFSNVNLVIEIPENYYGELNVKTSNGKVELSDLNANNIDIKTSNAKVEIINVYVTNSLYIKTSNGKIVLKNIASDNNITCNTSDNQINLDNVTGNIIKLNTSNGKIEMDDVKADSINLETSNGKIEFNNIDVSVSLLCKTSNNSVKGTIIGSMADFTITSKTTNNKNNLPEYADLGEKELNVKTSNGKIEIDFIR